MSITPEMKARLEAFKAVKVKHPRLEEVDRAVMRAIDEHASYSQLMLYGPTGAGKSTVAKRITERRLEAEPIGPLSCLCWWKRTLPILARMLAWITIARFWRNSETMPPSKIS